MTNNVARLMQWAAGAIRRFRPVAHVAHPEARQARRGIGLVLLVLLQAFCVLSLFGDMLSELLPFSPPASIVQSDRFEYLQNTALLVSLLFTSWELFLLIRRNRHVERELRGASGAFSELLHLRFDAWALTVSEKDVALLAVKGLAIGEIAGLRNARAGTVKAQLNAIYRKASVNGRAQFVSLFIEDLMQVALMERRAAAGREKS